MTNFRKDQDVEARLISPRGYQIEWRAAKIVIETLPATYLVEFPDGSRDVFDAKYIRTAQPGLQKKSADTFILHDAGGGYYDVFEADCDDATHQKNLHEVAKKW